MCVFCYLNIHQCLQCIHSFPADSCLVCLCLTIIRVLFIIIIMLAAIAVFLSGSWWIGLGVGVLAVILTLVAIFKPEKRKTITTEINRMDT